MASNLTNHDRNVTQGVRTILTTVIYLLLVSSDYYGVNIIDGVRP